MTHHTKKNYVRCISGSQDRKTEIIMFEIGPRVFQVSETMFETFKIFLKYKNQNVDLE